VSEMFLTEAGSQMTYAEHDQRTDSIEERRLSAVGRNEEIVALIRTRRAGTGD